MRIIILTFIFIFTNVLFINSQLLFKLGNQGITYGRSVTIDKDSNVIVGGTFQGTLNFDPKGQKELSSNLGSIDAFLAKYDKTGNLLWVKNVGTSGTDITTDIEVDKDGNVFIAGYFGTPDVPGRFIDLDPGPNEAKFYGEGGIDCFLIKLDSDGEYQWGFLLTNIYGFSYEIIWDIEVNYSGQIFLGGIFSGTVDFNPKGSGKRIDCPTEKHGYFAARYDQQGRNIWVSTIGANIANGFEEGFASIDTDDSDGCILVANFRDTARFDPDINTSFIVESKGETDILMARYNSYGKISMRLGFGGPEKDLIFPKCAKISPNGSLFITGNFLGKSDFYPGHGEIELENSGLSPEIFFGSYSLSGTLKWVKKLNSDGGEDTPCAIDFDSDANFCIAGYFQGTTNFSPEGNKEISSNGKDGAGDAFISKYDYNGNLMWANNYGDFLTGNDLYGRPQITIAHDIIIDKNDNVIITGRFFGEIDFDPSSDLSILKVDKQYDMFLAKYDYDGYLWYPGVGRPSLRIISPNGGESWNVDSTRVITWYSRNVEKINIEYSIDDGNSWFTIADSVSASSSSYTWVVENNPSEECRVKISNTYDLSYYDISNGKFTITNDIKPSRVIFSWGNPGPVAAKAVVTDSRNDIIIAGSFQGTINCDRGLGLNNLNAKGNTDMILAKYNEIGDLVWAENIGSDAMTCEPNCIAVDESDNIYVAGYFGKAGEANALFDFSPGPKVDTVRTKGGYDAFIAKYNSNGEYVWVLTFGNINGTSMETINDISLESNGTIYITGVFNGKVDFDPSKSEHILETSGTTPELFIAKYNGNGDFRWADPINNNIKNPEKEGLASIQNDGSGGCYLSGVFSDTVDFDPSAYKQHNLISKAETDIFIAHYKINSYLDWVVGIEGDGYDFIDNACLKTGRDGNLYISGKFAAKTDFSPGPVKIELIPMSNNDDIFLASYTTLGKLRWVTNFPSANGEDLVKAMDFDTAGNILLTGYFMDDIQFGLSENSLTFNSLANDGSSDIFLAKFANDGSFLWAKQFGTDSSGKNNLSQSFSIANDKKNNPVITGAIYDENIDFDPSENTFFLSSQGRCDAFIAKYFENGELWIQAVDTSQLYLKKPNGGELFQIESRQDITWHSKYIDTLSIKYSTNSGTDWITIKNAVSAESGSVSWIIPNTPSEHCKVLIYDPYNTRRADISAKEFTITDKILQVLSPNGSEIWDIGTSKIIQWKSSKIDYIDIYISIDAGKSWYPIVVSYEASKGFYTWNVTALNSENCLIKIIDRKNPELFDISDDVFTIRNPELKELKLIKPNGGEIWLYNNEYDIKWESVGIENINIELSANNGNDWINIVSDYDSRLLNYKFWLDSNYARSDFCLIKLSSVTDHEIFDISDSVFSIDVEEYVTESDFGIMGTANIFPNPGNNSVKLEYSLNSNCFISIKIVDVSGKICQKVFDGYVEKGNHLININTEKLYPGSYILQIESEKNYIIRKFIITG
jgi:hypothetical protein